VSRRWIVGADDGPTVADILIKMGETARAAADGRVFARGRRLGPADAVATGDELEVHAPRDLASVDEPRVLARRGGLLIAEKPAGLATTQDRRGGRSLVGDLAKLLGVDAARVHAASRLDLGVSGVVVCCLDDPAIRAVERARAAGRYARVYVAIASARIEGAGTWDAPIGTVRRGGRAIPAALGRDAKPAETRFTAVAAARDATLLRLEPITGRTHQLRVHAAHENAPLFGDREHGGRAALTDAKGRVFPFDRVALHALSIRLPDASGELLEAASPVPATLRALWNALDGDERAWDSVGSS
jgi:23S rRNA-/tRNA-specific pseudouridylate synthase